MHLDLVGAGLPGVLAEGLGPAVRDRDRSGALESRGAEPPGHGCCTPHSPLTRHGAKMTRSVPVTPTPAAHEPTSWWAGGLRLTERLGGDVRADRTGVRLAKWRAAHDTAEQFAARLADADLDETALGAMPAEPTQEPAARTERPTWAAFVARASTDAARAPFTGGTWAEAFAHVLRPLTVEAAAQDPRLDDEFTRQLDAKLVRIAARALVRRRGVLPPGADDADDRRVPRVGAAPGRSVRAAAAQRHRAGAPRLRVLGVTVPSPRCSCCRPTGWATRPSPPDRTSRRGP